ncbi:MAG: twin-arginine translocation pathway signal protein, partial [Candidatus Aminicenantales bacterium]
VYESNSPTRAEFDPLDYLYKWYLWCWAFGDLARDRPCITIPDDHDVYQGNLWGAGGRRAERQDDGGYTRPPEFVNLVQKTQTSHLPDPFDPTPVEQGIGVYYCALNVGPISLAVLEDRKFKSSPTVMVPEGKAVNGWFQNPDFNPAEGADVPGATLLGERQLDFLSHWAADWSHGARIKAVLSQTLFSNVATIPKKASSGAVLPETRIFAPDEYPDDWKLAADADSNAWPQTGRNRALREMRRGLAVHICGDQHLGSTIQYGIETWRDGPYAVCVPSIANFWPRRWYPPEPGANRRPGMPRYTGDYRDGFGNRMTVLAVSNPTATGLRPAGLYDQAPGYGIIRFSIPERTVTIACWPRWEDPGAPGARPYPGWPITIHQEQNDGRPARAYLPLLRVRGLDDPVVQVIEEASGDILYTLRISGDTYRPKVFRDGLYTLKVGDPDTTGMKTFPGLRARKAETSDVLEISFGKEKRMARGRKKENPG